MGEIKEKDSCDKAVRFQFKEPKEYKENLHRLLTLEERKEHSLDALYLTSVLIDQNPADYTVWLFRRDVLRSLLGGESRYAIEDEYEWILQRLRYMLKNYQAWYHVEWVARQGNFAVLGSPMVKSVAELDEKNIHFWGFLLKSVKRTGAFRAGLDFTEAFLDSDVRNNSAWTFRHEMLLRLIAKHPAEKDELLSEELAFLQKRILLKNNPSFWNYASSVSLIDPSFGMLPSLQELLLSSAEPSSYYDE